MCMYICVCMYNVCVIRTHISLCIVNINVEYPLQRTLSIVRPTANTHIIIENNFLHTRPHDYTRLCKVTLQLVSIKTVINLISNIILFKAKLYYIYL